MNRKPLAAALLTVTASIAIAAAVPFPPATTTRTYSNDASIAWSFWNNEPSMRYTREYVAGHQENVAYLGSVHAPETADETTLGDSHKPDLAVYDTDAHEWHVFRITAD